MMATDFFGPRQRLLCKDGSSVLASQVLGEASYVLLYFAASWCEPCCEFAAMLKDFYERYHEEKQFEVVLLSFDNSEQAMLDYFTHYHGNYYCLPYADAKETRIRWMEENDVKGLPTLVIFKNGSAHEVVTPYGCNMVVSDPQGVYFPWPQTDALFSRSVGEDAADAVAVSVPPLEVTVSASADTNFFDDPNLELLCKDGTSVLATKALADVDYVLVYFSGEWCPHCVAFTPQLKTFYEQHHEAKKFQIVFFSYDFSEKEMWEYFTGAHGDYLCLPYDTIQAMKPQWSKDYDVKGIPKLVVFKKGFPRVVETMDGRNQVVADPEGANFPWEGVPPASAVLNAVSTLTDAVAVTIPGSRLAATPRSFFGNPSQQLLRQNGKSVLAIDALKDVDYVLVYFSAHWCPYCREFTPLLKKYYEDHHDTKKFEVVFFSLDNSEEDMLDYFHEAHGDYYCLPYADATSMQADWLNLYNVEYIPTLLLFKNGFPRVLLSATGTDKVRADPEAVSFPWTDAADKVALGVKCALFALIWLFVVVVYNFSLSLSLLLNRLSK